MRLRRRGGSEPGEGTPEESPETAGEKAGDSAALDLSAGPFDADDHDLEEDPAFADHVDLGALLVVTPPEGVDLQLQVDEESGTVVAVLFTGEEGALELRPFAASRNADMWPDVRRSIAAETTQRGGTTSERSGDFGTELLTQISVTAPDGSAAIQPTRVIGVTGPRWFLRATLLGRPAIEPEGAAAWEELIRRSVVRRGSGAMPPGEALPMQLPAQD